MSNGQVVAPLVALCRLITDGTHDSPKLQSEGVPFIKGKHISAGFIDFDNCDFITYEDHLKVISRSKPEMGDTIFSNIGSVGDIAFVSTSKEFSIKNVALFKPDPAKVAHRYLFYLLKSPDVQGELLACKSGSAQPFIGLGTLREHQVRFHSSLPTQRRIASVLSAYDDLIENNTRRIAILEEMARRLYEEWFVQFRFPGHEEVSFKATDLGRIPSQWSYMPLEGLYDTSSGGTPSRKKPEFFGDDHRWVKTKELKDGPIFETEERITEAGLAKSSAKIFPPHTIIIAMYGANIGQLGVLMEQAATNQACCAILPSLGPHGWAYAFLTLLCRRQELIDMRTGAAQQNISQAIIKGFQVLKAGEEVHTRFEELAAPFLQLAFTLHRANANLRAQRDLLLPKLISGEIDVSSLPLPGTEDQAA